MMLKRAAEAINEDALGILLKKTRKLPQVQKEMIVESLYQYVSCDGITVPGRNMPRYIESAGDLPYMAKDAFKRFLVDNGEDYTLVSKFVDSEFEDMAKRFER